MNHTLKTGIVLAFPWLCFMNYLLRSLWQHGHQVNVFKRMFTGVVTWLAIAAGEIWGDYHGLPWLGQEVIMAMMAMACYGWFHPRRSLPHSPGLRSYGMAPDSWPLVLKLLGDSEAAVVRWKKNGGIQERLVLLGHICSLDRTDRTWSKVLQ